MRSRSRQRLPSKTEAGDRREVFLAQVRSAAGRSALYEELWRSLADEPLVDSVVDEYRWDTPLSLAAGLHYLVLEGRASWDDVLGALDVHRAFLNRFVVEQGVQTNEVQRSWMLLPCFLEVARRTRAAALDIVELGPSAGLNLVWDRYHYRYQRGTWGRAGSELELSGEERRPVPGALLSVHPRVRDRVGIDLAPIDVSRDRGVLLLKSFVWPDQAWRLEQLDRAIASLRVDPPQIVDGDVIEELPRVLAARREGAITVVFETAVLGYLPDKGSRGVLETLEDAGLERPLALISTQRPATDVHDYWGLFLTTWPGGERELLAHADFHGAWLEWLV